MSEIPEFAWVLENLTEDAITPLSREPELGQRGSFAPAIPRLRAIRNIVAAVEKEPADELPSSLAADASNILGPLPNTIQAIRVFNPGVDDALRQRDSLLGTIDGIHRQVCQSLKPQIRGASVDAAARSSEIGDILEQARTNQAAVEEIVSTLRRTAGAVAAQQTSAYYEKQATEHKSLARNWLIASTVVAAVTVSLVIVLFVFISLPLDTTSAGATQWVDLVRNLILRVFVLSVPAYVLSLTIRQYRVNKHLQVVNDTKRNALNTYPLFVEAASTEEARGVITAELARSVFGAIETGYLQAGNDRTVIEQAPIVSLVSQRPGPPG